MSACPSGVPQAWADDTVVKSGWLEDLRSYFDVAASGVEGEGCFFCSPSSGTMKFLPQQPQRTVLPRARSGTCRMLRQRRFGQMTVINVGIDQFLC